MNQLDRLKLNRRRLETRRRRPWIDRRSGQGIRPRIIVHHAAFGQAAFLLSYTR